MIYTGYIYFSNDDVDDISGVKPPYLYGVRKHVDIQHNENLSDMNLVRLTLVDATQVDVPVVPSFYRSGLAAMCGSDFSNVKFRNIPHWSALDNNTVRVWATMSRGKPTEMAFWYILETV
jgi:hypothetical protein